MTDVFAEVDEEVRQDQLQKLAKKWGPPILGAVVVAVAAYGGWIYWKAEQLKARVQAGDAFAAALAKAGKETPAAALGALALVAERHEGGYRSLALLQAAALQAEQGKRDEAVALFERVAADAGADPLLRSLGTLLSVMHQADSGEPAQLAAKLAPLQDDKAPWRYSARELAAVLALRANDRARATTLYKQLADDLTAPAGLRARAAEMTAALATPR